MSDRVARTNTVQTEPPAPTVPLRLIVADDHAIVRRGVGRSQTQLTEVGAHP